MLVRRRGVKRRAKIYRRPNVVRQRAIQRINRPEYKSWDVSNSTDWNTTTECVYLCSMRLGDDYDDREGRKIVVKSIHVRGYCHATPSTGVNQYCRWLLVLDKQANGTTITAADVLAGVAGTRFNAFSNITNSRRFKILKDSRFTIKAPTVGDQTNRVIDYYRKLNIACSFSTDTGLPADCITNSLWLITMGSEAAGTTDAVGILNCRLRFTDN